MCGCLNEMQQPAPRDQGGQATMRKVNALVALSVFLLFTSIASAGKVFLTGHDPDFHAQDNAGAENLLEIGLSFVTNGTFNDTSNKFLWVESRIVGSSSHRVGEVALTGALNLTLGTHYDRANASEFAGLDLSFYSAIAIASSFGGILRRAELDALIARSSDIADFINSGGGLFASSECSPCGDNLLAGATAPDLFGYLPVDVTSIGAALPFTVTPFGSGLGLVDGDLNSPTHNSFGLVGGLNIVDTDSAGKATTLAGDVMVGEGGFEPVNGVKGVPEPATLSLLGIGLLVGAAFRKRFK